MISRREFVAMTTRSSLAVSAGSALLASSCLQDDAQAQNNSDAIDAHVHVWTPDLQRYPIHPEFAVKDMVPASFTPEELFAHSKPAGVKRIVLIQMSFYKTDNSYMLWAMEKYPGVFAGVGIIDEKLADAPATMKALHKRGVTGFRLYTNKANAESWQSSDSMKTMWKTAADTGQSMCLLANPDALDAVHKMVTAFPKTRVVIDHFARIGVSGKVEPTDLDNLCRLAKFPNVYVKTSAFYALGAKKAPYTDLIPMIMRLVKEYGAERLMWASDCPYQVQGDHTYAASIGLVRDHLPELTAAQRQAILNDTAAKVFFS